MDCICEFLKNLQPSSNEVLDVNRNFEYCNLHQCFDLPLTKPSGQSNDLFMMVMMYMMVMAFTVRFMHVKKCKTHT